MKKCAKCGAEYDDAYDGCPTCAKKPPVAPKKKPGCMFLPGVVAVGTVTTALAGTYWGNWAAVIVGILWAAVFVSGFLQVIGVIKPQ
jgi:hypothetical protein